MTPADVQALLKTLYRAALLDDLIGPVFWTAGMRLETHLPRIAAFWEMTLLGSGTYTGSPLALHRLNLARPTPEAKWVVFYSLGDGPDGGVYYDAHPIEQMSHHLTMLGYDMNDEPLSFGLGAPLRLRNESQLGFKQVKWVKGVEFLANFSQIGGGYGGYNPDHEFFGYRQTL